MARIDKDGCTNAGFSPPMNVRFGLIHNDTSIPAVVAFTIRSSTAWDRVVYIVLSLVCCCCFVAGVKIG